MTERPPELLDGRGKSLLEVCLVRREVLCRDSPF